MIKTKQCIICGYKLFMVHFDTTGKIYATCNTCGAYTDVYKGEILK